MDCNLSVNLAEQPEGGYTLTSNELPELVAEGDSVEEAMENLEDAYAAALELYEDLGRPVPAGGEKPAKKSPWFAAFPPESRIDSDADVPVDNGQLRFEAMLCEYELRLPGRKLRALGCEEHPRRGRGSHRIWRNALSGGSAVVPDYGDPGFEDRDDSGGAAEFGGWLGGVFEGMRRRRAMDCVSHKKSRLTRRL